jgi:hypothetical protein
VLTNGERPLEQLAERLQETLERTGEIEELPPLHPPHGHIEGWPYDKQITYRQFPDGEYPEGADDEWSPLRVWSKLAKQICERLGEGWRVSGWGPGVSIDYSEPRWDSRGNKMVWQYHHRSKISISEG